MHDRNVSTECRPENNWEFKKTITYFRFSIFDVRVSGAFTFDHRRPDQFVHVSSQPGHLRFLRNSFEEIFAVDLLEQTNHVVDAIDGIKYHCRCRMRVWWIESTVACQWTHRCCTRMTIDWNLCTTIRAVQRRSTWLPVGRDLCSMVRSHGNEPNCHLNGGQFGHKLHSVWL